MPLRLRSNSRQYSRVVSIMPKKPCCDRLFSCSTPTTSASSSWPQRNASAAYSSALARSEEHTSELQSLMRISYAVFCLKKKKTKKYNITTNASDNTTIRNHNKPHE